MRWHLPVPTDSRHQPARRLPLRADSCATLRSLSLFVLLIHDVVCSASPDRDADCPSLRTGCYVTTSTACGNGCDQIRLRLPGGRSDRSQSTMFLIPAFITFGS